VYEGYCGLLVRDRAQEASEQGDLVVESSPAEDLGRNRRTVGDAVVETLLLDRPRDGPVEAPGGMRDGVDGRSAGQDRCQGECADKQGSRE
jgi:hypothetical protein